MLFEFLDVHRHARHVHDHVLLGMTLVWEVHNHVQNHMHGMCISLDPQLANALKDTWTNTWECTLPVHFSEYCFWYHFTLHFISLALVVLIMTCKCKWNKLSIKSSIKNIVEDKLSAKDNH